MKFISKIIVLFIAISLLSSFCITSNAITNNSNISLSDKTNINNESLKSKFEDENNTGEKNKDVAKIDLDEKSNKVILNSSAKELLNTYNSQIKNEDDVFENWNKQNSLFKKFDFSNMGKSLEGFDETDGMLNYDFALMASSLSTYQLNTSLDKTDPNSKVFETGYSQNIKSYFNDTFGDLSKKKDLSLSELPNISTYTKQADKKRNAGMNSFLKSSDYKKVNSAISVGNIFSIAKSQLNGNSIYSLSSISSLQNQFSDAANSLDKNAKSKQSKSYSIEDENYNAINSGNKNKAKSFHMDVYNGCKTNIQKTYHNRIGVPFEGTEEGNMYAEEDDSSTLDESAYAHLYEAFGDNGKKAYDKNGAAGLTEYIENNPNELKSFLNYAEKNGGKGAKKAYKKDGLNGLTKFLVNNNIDGGEYYFNYKE